MRVRCSPPKGQWGNLGVDHYPPEPLEEEWCCQEFSEEDFFQTFPMRRNGRPMIAAAGAVLCGRVVERVIEPKPWILPRREPDIWDESLGPEPIYDHYPKGYFDEDFPRHRFPPRQLVPNDLLKRGLSREEAAAKAAWERELQQNYLEQVRKEEPEA